MPASPEGLRIQHSDGTANLAPKEIPSPLKEQFAYDLPRPLEDQPAKVASPNPSPTPAPAETPPQPSRPKTTAEIERTLIEQKNAAERVANLRLQAQRLLESATQYEQEAQEHSSEAATARALGRSSMQDAKATRDRETARQLRLRADNALSEAARLEREIRTP